MKTILYFKNRYIDKLEDLCNLFRGNINEDLKRELIASFQDYTLEKWLEEGDDECKLLLEKVKSVDKKSANQEIVSNLKQIFAEENIKAENSLLNFEDCCQIEEVAYEKIDSYGNATSALLKVKQKGSITFKEDEPLTFKLKIKIKVINPDNEQLILDLKIKKGNDIFSSVSNKININTYKNDIIETLFVVNHKLKKEDLTNTVSIEFNDKVLYSFRISNNKFSPIFSSDATEEQKKIILQILYDMKPIEGGIFTMGATLEQKRHAESDEKPKHQVMLSDYYLCKTVVTQEQWETIMGNNPSSIKTGGNYPVDNVSWDDTQNFIRRINKLSGKCFTLPTEAQWEYAARGGKKSKGYRYSGSDNIYDVAWFTANSYGSQAVATKQPNELGLYDMSGNVHEWCSDWYGDYSSSPQTNPQGPLSGSDRVFRGGNSWDYAIECRVSSRNSYRPGYSTSEIGFRLALSL